MHFTVQVLINQLDLSSYTFLLVQGVRDRQIYSMCFASIPFGQYVVIIVSRLAILFTTVPAFCVVSLFCFVFKQLSLEQ